MALYDQGLVGPYSAYNAGVIPTSVFGVAVNWFSNRIPLLSGLPMAELNAMDFKITSDAFRARTDALTASFADTTGTLMTVADSSIYDLGDVVSCQSEFLLVTAIASATTLTVTRGYAGTTAATHANSTATLLVSNTRTGAEIDLNALVRIPSTVTQNAQTVQHAYQVGGALASTQGVYASGYEGPLQRDKLLASQHTLDDFECAMYRGKGVALAATTTRPAMKGLKTLLTTNNTTSPTNGSAYKPSDLIRDTVQKCYDAGGLPTTLLVSTDFMGGLSIWGGYIQRIDSGTTLFGTPIRVFTASFIPNVDIVPAPLLGTGTCVCLSDSEARIRVKRPLMDKPRGSRGDAEEGDMIMEGAIEVDNQSHHAWVEGITAFSAT